MATIGCARKAGAPQISCPGARRALGMDTVNEEFLSGNRYLSLGLYGNKKQAKETASQVSIMNKKVYGVAVQPLEECITPPSVVICISTPNQAMRLIQGHIHEQGPTSSMQSMGMQGLCAELTVRPHQTNQPNVSLLCSNTRYTCAWGDGELGVGMPYETFPDIVSGVVETINATEKDSTKDAILTRSQEMGVDFDIRKGAAYYLNTSPMEKTSPPSPPLSIEVSNVSKTHTLKSGTQINALGNVNLDVRKQEFLTIVGPSGCGKSTLLNLMARMYKPDSGTITMHGQQKDKGLNLGFISQADTLLPWRTVTENVELALELRKIPKKERRTTADRLMDQVGLLNFASCYPFELSGGMKKRAAVIRALAYAPDIIFMDEPFVGLDVQTRDELEEDILNLWQTHRQTIVMVTHDLGEAITLSDRVILLSGRPASVKKQYDIPLPRPRSVVESKFSEEFISLHKRIWHDLSAEALKSAERNTHE